MLLLLLLALAATPKYYLLNVEHGKAVVELTGHGVTGAETDALPAKSGVRSVPPAEFPAFLKGKTTLQALTLDGPAALPLESAEVSQGCSNVSFTVSVKPGAAKSRGLAVLDGTFPPTAKLRDPQSTGNPGAGVRDAVWKKALAGLAPASATLVTSALGAKDLRFTAGKFARGAVWLVWIDAPLPDAPPEKSGYRAQQSFRFAALADAKGAIVETIKSASHGVGETIAGWTPLLAGDIDGDGVDEIVATVSYFEGGSAVLYRWHGRELTEAVLYSAGC